MAGTNTFINFSGVTVTPTPVGGTVGSAVPIDRVTSATPGGAATLEKFRGDADRFARVIAAPEVERTFEIETGDVAAARSLIQGAVYTVFGKLGDALNGITTGGGGISFSLINAVLADVDIKGEHAKYASATLKFEAFSADGVTDPLTVVAL